MKQVFLFGLISACVFSHFALALYLDPRDETKMAFDYAAIDTANVTRTRHIVWQTNGVLKLMTPSDFRQWREEIIATNVLWGPADTTRDGYKPHETDQTAVFLTPGEVIVIDATGTVSRCRFTEDMLGLRYYSLFFDRIPMPAKDGEMRDARVTRLVVDLADGTREEMVHDVTPKLGTGFSFKRDERGARVYGVSSYDPGKPFVRTKVEGEFHFQRIGHTEKFRSVANVSWAQEFPRPPLPLAGQALDPVPGLMDVTIPLADPEAQLPKKEVEPGFWSGDAEELPLPFGGGQIRKPRASSQASSPPPPRAPAPAFELLPIDPRPERQIDPALAEVEAQLNEILAKSEQDRVAFGPNSKEFFDDQNAFNALLEKLNALKSTCDLKLTRKKARSPAGRP